MKNLFCAFSAYTSCACIIFISENLISERCFLFCRHVLKLFLFSSKLNLEEFVLRSLKRFHTSRNLCIERSLLKCVKTSRIVSLLNLSAFYIFMSNREPVRRVPIIILCIHSVLFIWHYLYLQCTFDGCEQEFTKCNQLKIHQFVHTNEKPFRSVIKFHSCDFLEFL